MSFDHICLLSPKLFEFPGMRKRERSTRGRRRKRRRKRRRREVLMPLANNLTL
jgi:hypothetical protein